MEHLMKIIQGYQEKNNTTTRMMAEMKKMFEENFQNLEKENSLLKEQVTKKYKTTNVRDEETYVGKSKKEEDERKYMMNE